MSTHENAPAAGVLERLADWLLAIRPEDIAPASMQQAKLLLLDTIGCGLAARHEHAAAAVLAATSALDADGACSIIGSAARMHPPNAVLANGMLIRVLDLNDYVIEKGGNIGGHPSDNIPVALAFGESEGRSGRDMLAAIVFGYELYGRCKRFMERPSAWDGATLSGLVAPAMAGWLMRLDRRILAHALALSSARAATSAAVRWGEMSAAKSLANALVAQNGAQAALLARHGVTGPLHIAEHPRGIAAVFPRLDAEALLAPLPDDSYVLKTNVKTYPCVATGQAAVAAALALHHQTGGAAAASENIRVIMADTPTIRAHQQDEHRADARTREGADHSFPFVIAAALLDGQFGLAQFEGERWNDPTVRVLMRRMQFSTEEELGERAPGSFPCRIEATAKDGSTRRAEVLFPPGFSRGGLDRQEVLGKFEGLTPHLTAAARQGIVEAVMALEDSPSLAALTAALSEAGRA